jgi:hypothetical protein
MAPSISSADQITFTAGQGGSFAITAVGAPLPAITEKGKLPKGLRFTTGKGDATISGVPKSTKLGTYALKIKASNLVKANVTQSLLVTVKAGSTLTRRH